MSEQYDPSNILNSEGCVYVRYEVYAALQAENERLRSVAQDNKAETEATRLQNERLRKAGDACAVACRVMGSDTQADEWEAAKEVQS